MNRPLYSGELARLAGVSADTVRHYERNGLLPAAARSASGYRIFPGEAVGRMRLIRAALCIGFSIAELADIFRERNFGKPPCRRVRSMAAEKLATLEARLREMRSWRQVLRATLQEWDRLLAKTPAGRKAGLLEAFAATNPNVRPSMWSADSPPFGKRKNQK